MLNMTWERKKVSEAKGRNRMMYLESKNIMARNNNTSNTHR